MSIASQALIKDFYAGRPGHIRQLAAQPLHQISGHERSPSGRLTENRFDPGCMGDKLYTDMSEVSLKVLRHYKVAVYLPECLACRMQLDDVLSHNNTGCRSGTC
ncbi:MAG: hypothetical protein LBN28_02025 [Desulfovibrio sp.]|nr:hypothetical protein [Desulfovibrio sp.]